MVFSNAVPHRHKTIFNTYGSVPRKGEQQDYDDSAKEGNEKDQEPVKEETKEKNGEGEEKKAQNGRTFPEGTQRRTFINFFIVDPSLPLPMCSVHFLYI